MMMSRPKSMKRKARGTTVLCDADAGIILGSFLPYARKGPLASAQSWRDFERMVSGDAMLFAVFLN